MYVWPIILKRFGSSGILLLFLANCQPTGSQPAEVVAPLPVESLKSVCLAWFNSLPTWADEDAEQTKNEVDYSYRVHEAACERYLKGE